MVDQGFLEEPRICMGLSKRHREVLRHSKEDEENGTDSESKEDDDDDDDDHNDDDEMEDG